MIHFIRLFSISAFLFISIGHVIANEKVYKYIDESGKTVFSTIPPSDNFAEGTDEITFKNKLTPELPSVTKLLQQPIKNSDRDISIYLQRAAYSIDDDQLVASFYIGGDCIKPIDTTWKELQPHRNLFLHDDQTVSSIIKIRLKHFNYKSIKVSDGYYLHTLHEKRAAAIYPEIIDLRLHSCVTKPMMDAAHRGSIFLQPSSLFDRSILWVKVRYSILDAMANAQDSIIVESAIGSWDSDNKLHPKEALKMALNDSVARMLANTDFVAAINQNIEINAKKKSLADELRKKPSKFNRAQKLPKWFQQEEKIKTTEKIKRLVKDLFGFKPLHQSVVSSRIKRIIAFSGYHRKLIDDYKSDYGYYPDTFFDIGLNPNTYKKEGYIKNMELLDEGIFKIYLDIPGFEDIHIKQTPPNNNDGAHPYNWRCETNSEEITLKLCTYI